MNLRNIRKNKKLNIKDLAEISHVPYRTIQNVERSHDCKISTAKKLARALNVSLDELCTDPEDK